MNYSKIKAFVFDVDGVFTDGGVICDLKGELYRCFNSKDGFAMRMAHLKGYKLGIITGGRSQSIIQRFLTLGVKQEDIYLGSRHKIQDIEDFCSRNNLSLDEVLYVGDDLPDMAVMQIVGISACPSDAVVEVKEIADYVIPELGGRACVRYIIEKIMKIQDKWHYDSLEYKSRF